MAIVTSDIVIRGSSKTGAAGDTTAQSNPNNWLGKYASTTVFATGLNGMFDDISGAENAASTVDYRCLFVLNNHATLTAFSVVAYLSAEVGGGAGISIAIDNTAASAKGASPAQAAEIATEVTAPSGVGSFSSPTTVGTGLSLGDLAAGQVRAVWVKRTAANSAALDADGWTIGIGCDTGA